MNEITTYLPRVDRSFKEHLEKNKYDIDYAINLLRQIERQVEDKKMSPKDLQFSLSQSLKRMISSLEVEKHQMNRKTFHNS